jgi:LEA14-like dessication related protein
MFTQKKLVTSLGLAAAVGLASYFIRLKKLSEQIEYRFKKVSRNKSAGSITVEIDLINPTSGAIKINSIEGSIMRGASTIAVYRSKKPFFIKANSTTPLSLAFQINRQALLQQLLNTALTMDAGALDVRYRLNTDIGNIPVAYKVKLTDLI